MAEFGVDVGVRLVAAGGHIEIVHGEGTVAHIDAGRDVPAVGNVAKAARCDLVERVFGDDGDPVIALLAVNGLMGVTGLGQCVGRKLVVGAFDLLQAQDIGGVLGQEIEDDGQPQPHRIDVPGGKRRHGRLGSWKGSPPLWPSGPVR